MDSKIINPNGPALMCAEAQRLRKATGSSCTQFVGKVCTTCGGTTRQISNGTCTNCNRAARKAEYRGAPEKFRERKQRERAANPDYLTEHRKYMNRKTVCKCGNCGADIETSRYMKYHHSYDFSTVRYCPHCRPEHLESVQPDAAAAWLYVFLVERPGEEHTVFGITSDWRMRKGHYSADTRRAGMAMGKAQLVGPMRRDEALQIETRLKALVTPADGLDFCGAKTESLRGDRRAELLRLMR